MAQNAIRLTLGDLRVVSVTFLAGAWTVGAEAAGDARCPSCGRISTSRHSSYRRRLSDLPSQGAPIGIDLRVGRWRCRNESCMQAIFAERLPDVAGVRARRTVRTHELVRVLGHCMGGRPGERLATRLGFAASKDTILRHLKRPPAGVEGRSPLRAVGIDEWAWRKGHAFGTIVVDLERRTVADVLPDRSAASTAAWLASHPEIRIVARDRDGLYGDAARQGAPQAQQIADRFHLIQNLRLVIERQLSRLEQPIRSGKADAAGREMKDDDGDDFGRRRRVRLSGRHPEVSALFAKVRAAYDAGRKVAAIARDLGLKRRTAYKWVRLTVLPERNRMASKASTPARFGEYLARRWNEGCMHVRTLLHEVRDRGYTGCYSQLAAFLSPWRQKEQRRIPPSSGTMPPDPGSGRTISPIVAAALCIRPPPLLSARQRATVDVLKAALPEFARIRGLAMRFRGLMRGGRAKMLDDWLDDAATSGIHGLQRFAKTIRQDIDAVRGAASERWNNGPTEGQVNRLKVLKRSMYGRAGIALLRIRMLPLATSVVHQD
jgi:transposase